MATINSNNFRGLSQLCDEFRFRHSSAQLSQFSKSTDIKEAVTLEARMRLSALEDRMHQREQEIAELLSELLRQSQAQASALAALSDALLDSKLNYRH
jgi:hypothetical protein